MFSNLPLLLVIVLFVAVVVFAVVKYSRQSKISQRLLGDLAAQASEVDNFTIVKISNVLEARLKGFGFYTWLTGELANSSSKVKASRYIFDSILIIVLSTLAGLLLNGPATGILLLIVSSGFRAYYPVILTARRRTKFQDQFDYTLNLFSASIRAGHSIIRAIEIVAIQAEAPTSQEFSKALNSIRLGRDLGDSLLEVSQRMQSQELEWVVQSINIHRESGGNLTDMFETVVATIKDRASIRVLIRTLSTDGRVSGQVMSILPLAIVLLFGSQKPETFAMFINTQTGNVLLAIAVGLYITGVLWIRKIVTVKF
jgi:tight adherence protein B